MLKLIGSILILLASTFGGVIYARTYIYRFKELNEIERCMCELENEIIYTHTPLPEAIKKISVRSEKPVSDVFNLIAKELSNNTYDCVYDAFCIAFSKVRNIYLKKSDVNIVLDLAKSLGESDINGQVNIFILTKNSLKKAKNEAEVSMKKNVKMFRYLGFSIGAMTVIMLL